MAAQGILKRELLFSAEKRDGVEYIKPLDWCRVTTSLGTMLEPRTHAFFRDTPFVSLGAVNYEDEACMVNGIDYIDPDSFQRYYDQCFSLHVEPRTGR